jgi:hypothetical protein
MKAPIVTTTSRRLRCTLVVAVAAIVSAVALSACGGSASTATGELAQARQATANHIHREDRLRRLEARLHRVDHRSGKAHSVPIPTYVAPAPPTVDDGSYYNAAPAPSASPTEGSCGGELSVNSHTSCPFAQNVENAYYAEVGSGSGEVVAYSPVTERDYTMSCSGSPHECTGGDDAAVFFP